MIHSNKRISCSRNVVKGVQCEKCKAWCISCAGLEEMNNNNNQISSTLHVLQESQSYSNDSIKTVMSIERDEKDSLIEQLMRENGTLIKENILFHKLTIEIEEKKDCFILKETYYKAKIVKCNRPVRKSK